MRITVSRCECRAGDPPASEILILNQVGIWIDISDQTIMRSQSKLVMWDDVSAGVARGIKHYFALSRG